MKDQVQEWYATYGTLVLGKKEYQVLQFILNRTLRFGKLSEFIQKSHFLEGVKSDVAWITAPAGVNSRDLYAAIARLIEIDFIHVTEVYRGNRHVATVYTVDVSNILSSTERPDMLSKLKISKKQCDSLVPNGTTPPDFCGTNWHLQNTINKKNNLKELSHAKRVTRQRVKSPDEIDCKAKVSDVIEAAKNAAMKKRMEKVTRGGAASPKNIKLTDLNAVWADSLLRARGRCNVVGLSYKQFGIFKRVIKAHVVALSWKEFFDWAISQWSFMNASFKEKQQYRKLSGKGWNMSDETRILLGTENPDLFQVVTHFRLLLTAYADRNKVQTYEAKTEDVSGLKEELRQARRQIAALNNVGRRTRLGGVSVPSGEQVGYGLPHKEFDKTPFEDDEELPEWRDQA
jgi:hypothetical protein